MSAEKLVSVCINCYNAEDTIENTLASVLRQTHRRLQVIVVDDGSTDGTRDILRRFDDERLTLCLLSENGHISNANNEALRRCEGEYIAHLDADDIWFPEKIQTQVAFLEEHPEYGAVFSVVEPVDENGQAVKDDRFRAENRDQAGTLRYLLECGNYLCHSSMLARKEIMDRVGLHDVSLLYLHDYDLWVRMALVCPFYVLDEPLMQYRIASNSNSNRGMPRLRFGAHMVEHARIHYRAIVGCPDDLFLTAFADRLRRPDLKHTHEQTELEKAFVLMGLLTHLPQNPALGLRRMAELMNDDTYRAIARRDFSFTARDFYAMQETLVFHNEAESTHFQNLATNAEAHAAAVQTQFDAYRADSEAQLAAMNAELAQTNVRLAATEAHKAQIAAAHEVASRQLTQITSSRWWRLGAPLRFVQQRRHINRTAKHPHLKDGRPAKAVVAVYGFFGHNLGDDLFFDRLFTRYPDTAFVVFDAEGYEDFFAAYPNVYSYTRQHPFVARYDALWSKLGRRDAFEKLLLSKADAVVHIGGSIYQQIASWETDMKLRKKRYKRSRPFFSISSNFGPYHTEGYRTFWRARFAASGDICFRDTYSASLFEDVKTVRYAPDLLFSQPLPAVPREDNTLFVAVIDPAFVHRSFTEEQAQGYLRTLTVVCTRWLEEGGTVNLAAFCPFEGDMNTLAVIKDGVPEPLRARLRETVYTSTVAAAHAVVDAVCRSSHVLATRFHAMLFGFASGARTVPLCYNQKMDHVLADLKFDGHVLSMDDMCTMTADEVIDRLRTQAPFDVRAMQAAACGQFDKLDAFLQDKQAEVKEEIG